ncbi:hypothetical protein [Pseudogemmobacter sonorensis]|uniref:hypothetical protein n=1 Tax=Pseudogemmobacter sonorensis TaxID=2989681 RepID=UPI0036A66EB0
MPYRVRNIQGKTKVYLFLMDEGVRDGKDAEVCKAFESLIGEIRKENGIDAPTLFTKSSHIIELNGMLFWINSKENGSGFLNSFVLSRRAKF